MKKVYVEMVFCIAHWMIHVGYALEDYAYRLEWNDPRD